MILVYKLYECPRLTKNEPEYFPARFVLFDILNNLSFVSNEQIMIFRKQL
jgi:hypothetical protein